MAADPADLAHLLRRTEFVVRPERFAELSGLTRVQAVDNVLDLAANGNPQLPAYLTSADTVSGWNQYVFAVNWWFERMVTAPRAFQEKMTLFWHGHFTSSWWDVDKGYQMMLQNQLYRSLALGNLVDLTQQMSLQPAMLVYLSNADNRKAQPNQNFARELMELFTLGVGNYTETDVDAAARAWTGYNYSRSTQQHQYVDAQHDASAKTFFGVSKPWTGPQIIDEILQTNPAKRLVAARFIATKLWEFLAYVGPSAALVDVLANAFIASGMDVATLARTILNRDEFYSTQATQGLVRTPIEYVAALRYGSGIAAQDLGAAWRLESTGQAMYRPPNVAGWKPNGAWLNTSALSARAAFADNVAWKLAGLTQYDNLATLDGPSAVDAVTNQFGLTAALGRPLSNPTRDAILAWRAGETNGYWRKRNLFLLTLVSPEMSVA